MTPSLSEFPWEPYNSNSQSIYPYILPTKANQPIAIVFNSTTKMEPETKREIEKTVISILKNSDMDEMTEAKVRKLAAEKLGIDLSRSDHKRFVRNVVESYLQSKEDDEEEEEKNEAVKEEVEVEEEKKEAVKEAVAEEEKEEEEEEEEEEEDTKRKGGREYDDNGDLIICRLSNKRRVTIQEFRGKTLVSIREYYQKDGKDLPTSKGISLTVEQWAAFSKSVPKIEESIKKMES